MFKQAFVVLALACFAFSAPQPKKLFHEHFDDFMDIIIGEVGDEIDHLLEHYLEYEEFSASMSYIQTNNFKDLVYEMEALPEFIAVVDFLEKDNIDIHYFIDLINAAIEDFGKKRNSRHSTSGTDLTSFINDCIAIFPKDKLSALYDEKMATDEEFSTALNNLQSEEWREIFNALLTNETFEKEVNTLNENGIDIRVVFDEILAVFGQN